MTARPRTPWFIGTIAAVLYFSEGLPYGFINDLLPIYLRMRHVPLREIGLLSTVGSAWILKVLWSPLVDLFGTYRRWIITSVAIMILLLIALTILPIEIGPLFWAIVTLLALASATQDLAVDAFTIRTTPAALVGPVNSIRVTAYRVALIAAGSGLAWIAGSAGWRSAFGVAAAVAAVALVTAFAMPHDRGERTSREPLLTGLLRWLARPKAGQLLALVFLYRLGEFAILPMIKPYWVDRGYSPAEIGAITSTIGTTVSVVGAIAGGVLVARFGIWRGLLWLGLAQTVSNLGYAITATSGAGRWAIYAASIAENAGYGLGTAAFLALLMAICDRQRAATEYALLTAAFGLSRSAIGSVSGLLAERAGYAGYFWLTVALGIPGLLLLPLLRDRLAEPALPIANEPVLEG